MLKNWHCFSISFITFLFCYIFFFQDKGIVNKTLVLDSLSMGLILMTLICMMSVIWLVSIKVESINFLYINLAMVMIFIYLYLTNSFFIFYIIFEISVVPMMFYISSWGYSLDRIKAMMYMFMYTFFFSLPFLLSMMYLNKMSSMNLIISNMHFLTFNDMLVALCLTMFLVKIPVWGLHLWLPKAHVEASTEGSMVLAGVVLKLAGIGLIKFSSISAVPQHSAILFFVASLSVTGALAMGIYCTRQSDAKVIIALSSIVHMSFLFLCYMMNFSISFSAMMMVMIAHGIISPLMFLFLGEIYNSFSSRSLQFLKGVLKNMLFISALWFILCMFNMGLPLSMNFFGEMVFFFSSNSFSLLLTMVIASLIFINGFFNSFLLIFLSGGREKEFSFPNGNMIVLSMMYMFIIFVIFFTPMMLEM